ncbi:hypothetical protein BH09BAC2_BH09BAC2_18400 [soil metagenome]
MKKILTALLAIILFSATASAQINRDPTGKNRHPRLPIDSTKYYRNHPSPQNNGACKQKKKIKRKAHAKMIHQLSLTEAQQSQLKTIHDDFKTRMQSLKSNQNITVAQLNSQKASLQQEKKAKVLALLTPEQKTKLEQLKEERKQQMQVMQTKRIERMKTELNLSAQQLSAIQSKNENFKVQIKAIRENTSLSQEQKMDQMKVIKEQRTAYIKTVLTAEQYNKWQESKKTRDNKRMSP